MKFIHILTCSYTNISGHFISTNFAHVSAQHTKIQTIVYKHETDVHPHGWRTAEHKIKAQKCQHHDDVADDSETIAQFVYEVKPFVDQSAK